MNVYLLRWIFLYIHMFPVFAKLSILLSGVDVTDMLKEPIKVLEGDRLAIECISDRDNATLSWIRNYAITVNKSLEIENVRLADAGMYFCTSSDVHDTQNVAVDVLYPPSYPVIEGTATGIVGEHVTLECICNANPPPTYQWRRGNRDGALLSRNQTFKMTIPRENGLVVCLVQSLMVATLGRSKSVLVSRDINILSYVKANILSIENGPSLKVKEGEDVDILCATVGQPAPDVWWTKVGNDSFYFEGSRLIEYEVNKEFAGVYDCHAQNSGSSVNKTVTTTYDTKPIHIKVTESSVSKMHFSAVECANYCDRKLTDPGVASKNKYLTSDDTNTPGGNDKHLIIIITATIGWAVVIIIFFINILCCMLKKRKKTDKDTETETQTETQTDELSEMYGYTYARSLSDTSSSYITQVRFPESIYLDINSCDMLSSEQIDNINTSPTEYNKRVASNPTCLDPIFASFHTTNH